MVEKWDSEEAHEQNSAPINANVDQCGPNKDWLLSSQRAHLPTCLPQPWFPYVPSHRSKKSYQRLLSPLSGSCDPTAKNGGDSRLNSEVSSTQIYKSGTCPRVQKHGPSRMNRLHVRLKQNIKTRPGKRKNQQNEWVSESEWRSEWLRWEGDLMPRTHTESRRSCRCEVTALPLAIPLSLQKLRQQNIHHNYYQLRTTTTTSPQQSPCRCTSGWTPSE